MNRENKKVYCENCKFHSSNKVTCTKRYRHPILEWYYPNGDCRVHNKKNDCIDYEKEEIEIKHE